MRPGHQALQFVSAGYGLLLVGLGVFTLLRGYTDAQAAAYDLAAIGVNFGGSVLSVALGAALWGFAVGLDRERILPPRAELLSPGWRHRVALLAAAAFVGLALWRGARGPPEFLEYEWRSVALLLTGGIVAVLIAAAVSALTSPFPLLGGLAYGISAFLGVVGHVIMFLAPGLTSDQSGNPTTSIMVSLGGTLVVAAGIAVFYATEWERAHWLGAPPPQPWGNGARVILKLVAVAGALLAFVRLFAGAPDALQGAQPVAEKLIDLATVVYNGAVAVGIFWLASYRRTAPLLTSETTQNEV